MLRSLRRTAREANPSPPVRSIPTGDGEAEPGMKFPRKAASDADAHTEALDRLQEARDEQRRLTERRDEATGEPAEVQAEVELTSAGDQVAARAAWARWAARND